jgi:hypothetical protein
MRASRIDLQHNHDANAQQCGAALEAQYFVQRENRDQRRQEGNQDGDRHADDAVPMLAVPEIQSAALRV